MKRATASPASTWFCSKNSHWCTRAAAAPAAGGTACPRRDAAGSPRTRGSAPRSRVPARARARPGCARGAPAGAVPVEDVDRHRLERKPELAQQHARLQAVRRRRVVVELHSTRRKNATVSANARRWPRGRSGGRRRARRRARRRTRATADACRARPWRTVSRPASGVCGSRVPKISSSSPEISPARASEPASASAPSLPSCRPVGYQHAVPRTRASNAARNARCPPVQCPAAPTAGSAAVEPRERRRDVLVELGAGVAPRRRPARAPCPRRRTRARCRAARCGGRSRARRPRSRSRRAALPSAARPR